LLKYHNNACQMLGGSALIIILRQACRLDMKWAQYSMQVIFNYVKLMGVETIFITIRSLEVLISTSASAFARTSRSTRALLSSS